MKRIINKIIILIISIALFFALSSPRVQASSEGTIINADTVNIRKETSTDSKIVLQVAINDKVEVIEKNGEWYKVKKDDKEGYINSEYIKVSEEIKDSDADDKKTETDESENTVNNEDNSSEKKEETSEEQKQALLPAGINVKLTPNIMSNNIFTTTQDIKVSVLDQINSWKYVLMENGLKGWVRNNNVNEEVIKEEKEEEQEENNQEENKAEEEKKDEDKIESKNEKAYIKYSSVNLRKEPSTSADVIERLKLNTEVTIIEDVSAVWCKVKVGDNVGYISKELLSNEKQKEEEKSSEKTTSRDGDDSSREESKNDEKKESTNSSTKSSNSSGVTGEEIVAYAKQFLGKPYVYGGSSPSGFDCSGLTSYVYKHFGYSLSRTASGQASNGVKVDKDELQPGDLVLFKNHALTKIGHVGIYIGDGKMIHASEPKTGVIITDINSKAYKYPQRYATARRIIK